MLGRNLMHGYDVRESLYLNCEIHGPRVRGAGPRVGPIWPYNEKYLDLRKPSSLLPFMLVKNLIHGYDVHEVLYLN